MENFLDSNISKDEKDLENTVFKIGMLESSDILSWVEHIIPDWKIAYTKSYASEYFNLEQNWYNLCQQWNVKPKHIIIVKFIPNQNELGDYKIIWTLCNRLTQEGNIIRSENDLVLCENCNKAILSRHVINRINHARKQVKNPPPPSVPTVFNSKCVECTKSSDAQEA